MVDVYPEKVAGWMEDGDTIVIDVREAGELLAGRIAGARHLPLSSFDPSNLGVDKSDRVVFFCAHGIRSRQVGQWLIDHGYLDTAYSVAGGIVSWQAARLPLQTCAPCYPQTPYINASFGAGGYREHDILVVTEDGADNITGFPFGPEHNVIGA